MGRLPPVQRGPFPIVTNRYFAAKADMPLAVFFKIVISSFSVIA
jgi:hypothetical protein